MKKYLILLAFCFVALISYSQDKTVSLTIANEGTYIVHSNPGADTLSGTQDTIDFVFKYKAEGFVKKIAVKIRYDLISGVDTTVHASLFGKEFFDDPTWVSIIAPTTSSVVSVNNTMQILTSDYTETTAAAVDFLQQTLVATKDTLTVAARINTPIDQSYRFYRLRLIVAGDDSVGKGIKVDEVELKLYTE